MLEGRQRMLDEIGMNQDLQAQGLLVPILEQEEGQNRVDILQVESPGCLEEVSDYGPVPQYDLCSDYFGYCEGLGFTYAKFREALRITAEEETLVEDLLSVHNPSP